MPFQVRPKEGGDAYNPQRDLAYCYAPAMKEALRALDEANWTVEIRALCDYLDVAEEEVSDAVKAITEAHIAFITDANINHAEEALRNAGWYNQRAEVRYMIYGRLGEVILGGFFMAIRDVRMMGAEPPHPFDIADLIAEGKRISGQFARKDPEETSEDISQNHTIQLQFARNALEEQERLLQTSSRALVVMTEQKAAVQSCLDDIVSSGLWRGIRFAFVSWWRQDEVRRDEAKQNQTD
jgi:hypothetical protein